MANTHKRKHKRSGARSSKQHRNPHSGGRKNRRNYSTHVTRRRHRNPARITGAVGLNSLKDWLELGAGAAVGALGPGYLGNLFLGANNQGAVGYLVEGGISVVGGLLIAKFLSKAAGSGVIAGGLGALIVRIFQENTASHPVAIAQATGQTAGNSNATASGVGLGSYWPFEYQYPTTKQWINGQLIDGPRLTNLGPYPSAQGPAALPPGSMAAGSVPAVGSGPELSRYTR